MCIPLFCFFQLNFFPLMQQDKEWVKEAFKTILEEGNSQCFGNAAPCFSSSLCKGWNWCYGPSLLCRYLWGPWNAPLAPYLPTLVVALRFLQQTQLNIFQKCNHYLESILRAEEAQTARNSLGGVLWRERPWANHKTSLNLSEVHFSISHILLCLI